MTADGQRWDQLKRLYLAASELPRAERRAFLAAECAGDADLAADVNALLGRDGDGTSALLDGGVGAMAASLLAAPAPVSLDPEQFLPYRLVAPIGEGGMGVVYLAERDDLEMRVAIKILRDAWLSPARRKRFLAEQRTLAQLSHPGIARILDAHTMRDGTPWFVMEFVDGLPITDYCAGRGSPITERLRLFRDVCEAVRHAHEHAIVHRDLKPSNILVTAEGSVRLVDFGIAKRLDARRAEKDGSRTTIALMTPAYAAPEQLRGEETGPLTDVYSLGVVLYELLTGRLPYPPTTHGTDGDRRARRPSALMRAGSGAHSTISREIFTAAAELDVLCLTAMHDDPARRYQGVDALIADIDRLVDGRPLRARGDSATYRLGKWARRRWRTAIAAALLVVAGGAAAALGRSDAAAEAPGTPSVAVLPFVNVAGDSSLAYLEQALPEEIVATLASQRGVTVRAMSATGAFVGDTVDPRGVGRRLGVQFVVTGSVRTQETDALVTMRALRVADGTTAWEDRLTLQRGSTVGLQRQVATIAHGGLAASLGVALAREVPAPPPRNERAYDLYLRSAGARYDPGPGNFRGIAMLEEAVRLDPTFARAWVLLGRRYYIAQRFDSGGARFDSLMSVAGRRAVELDPNNVLAGARLAVLSIEQGRTVEAYRYARELLRRRADSPDVHFILSYVMRFAGLLRESAAACAHALTIDAHNYGWRSCAMVSIMLGDNEAAQGFLALDPGSEFTKVITIYMLARSGQDSAALAVGRAVLPQWKSHDVFVACLAGAEARVIDSLARRVVPSPDPETNYLAASHLGRCGRTGEAAALLERAIDGGYCSWPVMETDPFLATVRAAPRFTNLLAKGKACQRRFLDAVGPGRGPSAP